MPQTGLVARTRLHPFVRALVRGVLPHALILLGCFELYRAIGILAPRQSGLAHAHAAALVHLEQRLGIFIEPGVQRAFLHWESFANPRMAGFIDQATQRLYGHAQVPWLLAMLLWLWMFRRQHFAILRNLTVVSSCLGISLAALYPVAPPRFALTGPPYWMHDVTGIPVSEQVFVRFSGFDPYASMPSIHVLWAMLTGMGLWLGCQHRPTRALALPFPLAVMAVVVVTANHYLLDIVGSMLLLGVCLAAGRLWRLVASRRAGEAPASSPLAHRLWHGAPSLRPLDTPLILCGCISVVLLVAPDAERRLCGLALLAAASAALLLARRRVAAGVPLLVEAPMADWWCGVCLVLGTLALGGGTSDSWLLGAALWLLAGLLPLAARLRPLPANAAEAAASTGDEAIVVVPSFEQRVSVDQAG